MAVNKIKSDKLNEHEKQFLRLLLSQHPDLHDRIKLDNSPYKGTNYRSDLVMYLKAGEHPYLIGVVIEIQGGTRQGWGQKDGKRTGHSTPQAIARDNHKCVIAQLNRFFYLPVVTTPAAYAVAVQILNDLVYENLDFVGDEEDEYLK
jgi:hypothetical protein